MNVDVRNEAHLDIADGVAFYDRQRVGAGDYFYQRNFDDIESLSETPAFMKSILASIAKLPIAIPFSFVTG